MALEIERKFLLGNDSWKKSVRESFNVAQAYLSTDPARTVRVRLSGPDAFLTIKGLPDPAHPLERPEYEYAIPPQDAQKLLALCLPGAIEKVRHLVGHGDHTWEIDVFGGENEGLVLAEIELSDAQESFAKPDWLGEEVTHDTRYLNSSLAKTPFRRF